MCTLIYLILVLLAYFLTYRPKILLEFNHLRPLYSIIHNKAGVSK